MVPGLVHGLDLHPTQVSTPASTGAPDGDGDQATPANLSAPRSPNTLARSCWPAVRTFAQKCPARAIRGQVAEEPAGQNSTSGGSSDSAANDWQAKPAGAVGVDGGDDGDARAEVPEHLAEPRGFRPGHG